MDLRNSPWRTDFFREGRAVFQVAENPEALQLPKAENSDVPKSDPDGETNRLHDLEQQHTDAEAAEPDPDAWLEEKKQEIYETVGADKEGGHLDAIKAGAIDGIFEKASFVQQLLHDPVGTMKNLWRGIKEIFSSFANIKKLIVDMGMSIWQMFTQAYEFGKALPDLILTAVGGGISTILLKGKLGKLLKFTKPKAAQVESVADESANAAAAVEGAAIEEASREAANIVGDKMAEAAKPAAEVPARIENAPMLDRPNGLELFDTPDERTGFRGKSVLLSERGVAELNQALPAPKLLAFFDFKGMGPASKAGLDNQIDNFLAGAPELVRQSFKDIKVEPLRPGGDEFALIMPDTPAAVEAIRLFDRHLQTKRRKDFTDSPDQSVRERFTAAEKIAGARTAMRQLRSEFKEQLNGQSFTLEGFRNFLMQQGAKLPSGTEKLGLERQTGLLQASLLRGAEVDEVMSVSGAVVRLPAKMTTSDIARAMGEADKIVHADKAAGRASTLETHDLDASVVDKSGDQAERAAWQSRENEYDSLRKQFASETRSETREHIRELMNEAEIQDPAVPNVIRLDSARSHSARDSLNIKSKTTFNRLRVDVRGYGAINNNAGYTAADTVYRELASIVAIEYPDVKLVRPNGGALDIYISAGETVSDNLQARLADRFDQLMRSQPHYDAVLAEAGERHALAEYLTGSFDLDIPLDFGVAVDTKIVTISPSDPLGSIY